MKNDNYHLGQLNRPVSQIDIQRNMVDFVVDGHICYYCVPIAMYHHEPSRRMLIELGIKIKLLIATTTQSCSMHVCAIIAYVS